MQTKLTLSQWPPCLVDTVVSLRWEVTGTPNSGSCEIVCSHGQGSANSDNNNNDNNQLISIVVHSCQKPTKHQFRFQLVLSVQH